MLNYQSNPSNLYGRIAILLVALLFHWNSELFAQSPANPSSPKSIQRIQEVPASIVGEISDGVYSNKYFGFRLNVPESMVVLNRAEIDLYGKAAADGLKAQGHKNPAAVTDAYGNQVQLLMIAIAPPGTPNNAVFEMNARRQKPGVTAIMVLAESIKIATGTPKARLSTTLGNVKLGSKTFVGAEIETELNGNKFKQRLFVSIHRGYALFVGLTFADQNGMVAIENLANELRFDLK